MAEMIRALGYEPETARDSAEALHKLGSDFDVVLVDAGVRGLDGLGFLSRIRGKPEHAATPVIIVTTLDMAEARLRAVEAGASELITRPIDRAELLARVACQFRIREAEESLKRSEAAFEGALDRRTDALRSALERMTGAQQRTEEAYLDAVDRLAAVAEYRDEKAKGHVRRMRRYCELLSRRLKLEPPQTELISRASAMHDVGKVGIPDSILLKPAPLEPDEWEVMKRHSAIGADLLSGSSSDILQAAETVARFHHERWDGKGYPEGLSDDEIPLSARVVAVVEVFDALTSDRPYREAVPHDEALAVMQEERGAQFDPKILDAFVESFDEMAAIRREQLN